MRWLAIGMAMMVAACGDQAPQPAKPVDTTTNSSMAAAGAADINPAHCGGRPDFVVLRPDAKIETCTSGRGPSPRRESGTVIYTTKGKAADVVAWYRAQAKELKMQDAVVGASANPIYSARDGTHRNFMVITEPADAGTKVILNWGRDG